MQNFHNRQIKNKLLIGKVAHYVMNIDKKGQVNLLDLALEFLHKFDNMLYDHMV